MSRDEYIKMAIDAGLKIGQHWDKSRMTTDNMVRFARIVSASEREACAKLCEEVGFAVHGPGREDSEAYDCADAIRARGETAKEI